MSVALFTHLAKQLRRIMLAHVTCLPVNSCSIFFYTWHECQQKNIEHKILWFCIQSLSGICLIPSRNERYITINTQRTSCKVNIFVSDFNKCWIFFVKFWKRTCISHLMIIFTLGAELFHANTETDTTKLILVLEMILGMHQKEDYFP